MKKLISIDHLTDGMFLDADVAVEESGGDEPNRFLEPRNAVRTVGRQACPTDGQDAL